MSKSKKLVVTRGFSIVTESGEISFSKGSEFKLGVDFSDNPYLRIESKVAYKEEADEDVKVPEEDKKIVVPNDGEKVPEVKEETDDMDDEEDEIVPEEDEEPKAEIPAEKKVTEKVETFYVTIASHEVFSKMLECVEFAEVFDEATDREQVSFSSLLFDEGYTPEQIVESILSKKMDKVLVKGQVESVSVPVRRVRMKKVSEANKLREIKGLKRSVKNPKRAVKKAKALTTKRKLHVASTGYVINANYLKEEDLGIGNNDMMNNVEPDSNIVYYTLPQTEVDTIISALNYLNVKYSYLPELFIIGIAPEDLTDEVKAILSGAQELGGESIPEESEDDVPMDNEPADDTAPMDSEECTKKPLIK